ncbi:MAG: 23S rRNA (pseudouridine(1915)-N(3))-methyltransferase RlmH [Clostridiales bacterium]|nr:23S rRNA (pseudouridine(1915)-N(3))-methyltransferase RlmH [Clostridiales bacterium]
MLNLTLICVGRMREKYYIAAFEEYAKRLSPYCKLSLIELSEVKTAQNPSKAEIKAALSKEAVEIYRHIPSGSYLVAMCIEANQVSSEELARIFFDKAGKGVSRLCFIVGSSFGLDEGLKQRCDLRLSMSKMTFPHHLARVMLVEQLYRAVMINEKSKYHK